jgi:hypothetical protein
MKNLDFIVFIVTLIVVMIVAAPLILIWAINTLVPVANIQYSVDTWFAAFLVIAILSARVSK